MKLAHDTGVCATFKDLHKIEIIERDKILLDEPGVVGSGGNSGFQALNLALQFGARRILLIGFDMHSGNGLHWYGRNTGKGMRNPLDSSFARWCATFHTQGPIIKAMGVEVINASPDSAIRCFDTMSVEAALAHWAL